jgi:hypothetical protein
MLRLLDLVLAAGDPALQGTARPSLRWALQVG